MPTNHLNRCEYLHGQAQRLKNPEPGPTYYEISFICKMSIVFFIFAFDFRVFSGGPNTLMCYNASCLNHISLNRISLNHRIPGAESVKNILTVAGFMIR